jgi:hypothetical protein
MNGLMFKMTSARNLERGEKKKEKNANQLYRS